MYDKVIEIKRAILRGDEEYQGITLPKPQRTGTMTQQDTYAYLKAQEIYETNR